MGESSELNERQAFLVLNALPNIGPVTLNRLLAELGGDPRAVLAVGIKRLEAVNGIRPETADIVTHWREHFDLEREEERLKTSGADFITVRDKSYPELLRQIYDPPIGLYRKGRNAFERPCIAIVGSRRTTLYGHAVAKTLGAELAQAGFCVVSGLARGIDSAAHEGALCSDDRTVGVLGTGLDIVYPPENLQLYRRIEASGCILSEFPFGCHPQRHSFAMRNRIISGMCIAVIVVESGVDGGAMITARFAGEQGRSVFAVPGRIDQRTSAGCNRLIRDGASLLTSVDDIFSELNYLGGLRAAPIPNKPGSKCAPAGLAADELAILARFSGGAVLSMVDLAEQTGLPAAQMSVALLMLELKQLITKRMDGAYETTS
jgi:DNA processing protein